MATIRKTKISKNQHDFVLISQKLLEDSRLRWSTRGLLSYLLCMPDIESLDINQLKGHGDLGRDALHNRINEAINFGYLERKTERSKGRITGVKYKFKNIYDLSRPLIKPSMAQVIDKIKSTPKNKRFSRSKLDKYRSDIFLLYFGTNAQHEQALISEIQEWLKINKKIPVNYSTLYRWIAKNCLPYG
jgi:hypothetical protein